MMSVQDRNKDLIHRLLEAYNRKDDRIFVDCISDALPWKEKVLDEIRSGRAGHVDTLDVVAQDDAVAEYWVERGLERDGETHPEIRGVNVYRIENDVIVNFIQVEESRPADGAG